MADRELPSYILNSADVHAERMVRGVAQGAPSIFRDGVMALIGQGALPSQPLTSIPNDAPEAVGGRIPNRKPGAMTAMWNISVSFALRQLRTGDFDVGLDSSVIRGLTELGIVEDDGTVDWESAEAMLATPEAVSSFGALRSLLIRVGVVKP